MNPEYDLYESHHAEAKSFASKRHEPYEDQPVELDRSYAASSSRKGSMTGSAGKGAGINIIGHNRQYQQQAQEAGVANSMSSLSSSANSSNMFINASAGLKNSSVAGRVVTGTNSYSNSKHSSISTPQDSRRPSGNSITIKITNENAVNVHDEPISLLLTHNDFETLNEELRSYDNRVDEEPEEQTGGEQYENEQEEDGDLDESESTTSHSNEHLMRKKLKDKRKLVRSFAQQQHHLLLNQESEDRVDDERTHDEHITYHKHNKREPIEDEPSSTMNSAFDELFAAAESGNSTRLAAIEAKMATEAAAATAVDETLGDNIPFGKNSTKTRSRNSSFRSKHSGGSVKFSNSNTTNSPSSATTNNNNNNNSLTIEENYLGSPQQLTRSVSCKRPGSFKRMRSKASSPNRQLKQATSQSMKSGHSVRPTSPYIQGRRGTQGSISLMDANVHGESRAESLPFENFDENSHQGDTEIYRVRQFNTTNKGSVINRGDSFKRSFKKSTQSISSNKQPTPPHSYHDTNTLALPGDYSMKRSRHNVNNEASDIGVQLENGDSDEHIGQNVIISVFPQAPMRDENIQTFVVHLLGASSVGKSALIKQFHTSEYRGIYDINTQQSTGK
jgi:hypothetical protein